MFQGPKSSILSLGNQEADCDKSVRELLSCQWLLLTVPVSWRSSRWILLCWPANGVINQMEQLRITLTEITQTDSCSWPNLSNEVPQVFD